jgi:hypothetical protein
MKNNKQMIQTAFTIVGLGYAFYKKTGVGGYFGYAFLGSVVGYLVGNLVYPSNNAPQIVEINE